MPHSKLLKTLGLNNLNVLGTGLYSMVLLDDNGNALKVTSCYTSYKLAKSLLKRPDPYLITPIKLLGSISKSKKHKVYGLQLERVWNKEIMIGTHWNTV